MGDNSVLVEIVMLAMLAGFIGLRLYQVLGRRTGSEQPAGDKAAAPPAAITPATMAAAKLAAPVEVALPADTDAALREPLQAIATADRTFDPARFLTGAQSAYRLILEAFWRGDEPALHGLVVDDVLADFSRAIAERADAGIHIENRLIQLDAARIVHARLNGTMAEVSVRFDADLVAVTKDAAGTVLSGSETAAVETHDVWTFSRHTAAADPNWLLVATDVHD